MAGDYPDWDMEEATRAALRDQLDDALLAGVPAAGDVEGIVAYVGRDQLLEAMSGTSDKASREWKNARDRLSRYRRGARSPDQANQAAMRAAAEARRRQEVRERRRATVRYSATFTTSKKPWDGYADADLTGPALDDFLDAQAAGDGELAAQIVADAYGLDPEFVISISDVSGYTIRWLPPPGSRRWPPTPARRPRRPPQPRFPAPARPRAPAGSRTPGRRPFPAEPRRPGRALARLTPSPAPPAPCRARRITRT
jgi:hypothetical protein